MTPGNFLGQELLYDLRTESNLAGVSQWSRQSQLQQPST